MDIYLDLCKLAGYEVDEAAWAKLREHIAKDVGVTITLTEMRQLTCPAVALPSPK